MLSGERIERYELLGELATGGMATVYLGRQRGPFGFSRTVAIKSMHPHFAKDEGFRAMFLDEATLTAKIRHPNVVPTLDIVCASTNLLLVMEYVDGVSLAALLRAATRRQTPLAPAVAVAIICDVLHGLHAAHNLVDDAGSPLAVIHRDVSPQNIHVGVDGLTRILDFGIAKAASQRYVTQTNEIKGKIAYMSPQQLCGEAIDRRTDIYAAGVVLWEVLAARRLFAATNEGELVKKVLEGTVDPPGFVSERELPGALDRIVMKALAKNNEERWATAEEMARELAEALPPAPRSAVTTMLKELAGPELAARAARLHESASSKLEPDAKIVADLLTARATRSPMIPPPATPERDRSRRVVTMVAAFGVVTTLTVGAFVIGSRSGRPAAAPVASARQDEARATSIGSAAPALESSPSPVAAPAESAPEVAAASAASATTAGGVASAARPRGAPPRSAGAAPRSRPSVDCRVKYSVDVHGDRHYKPECVE